MEYESTQSKGLVLDLSEHLGYELLYQPVLGASNREERSMYPLFFSWLRPFRNDRVNF